MQQSQSPFLARFAGLQDDAPKLADAEFALLRERIYKVSGIHIPAARKYLLENRLRPRLEELGLTDFAQYMKLLNQPGKAGEQEQLFEQITTNETSFFRDMPQLEVFREKILEPMLRKLGDNGKKEMNIWCAGCSSGEEAYTLAMIVAHTLGGTLPAWNVRITANDLSRRMVETARVGVYSSYALRTTPDTMKKAFFSQTGEQFSVAPKIRAMVDFQQINLNDSAILKRIPRSHIIFCRNVIIYFDTVMKKRVIASFYDNLLDDCYIVLGHSESMHNLSRDFRPIRGKGGIVYQKQKKGREAA